MGSAVSIVCFYRSDMVHEPYGSGSEVVAILASGTSYNRFRPYMIGGFILD
jgi:hypothetical protein